MKNLRSAVTYSPPKVGGVPKKGEGVCTASVVIKDSAS